MPGHHGPAAPRSARGWAWRRGSGARPRALAPP
jgi:hypothetical protein